jgi:hypothetical protein
LLQRAARDARNAFASEQPWAERFAAVEEIVSQARAEQASPPTYQMLLDANPERLERAQLGLLALPEVVETTGRIGAAAGEDFLRAVSIASGLEDARLLGGDVDLSWLGAAGGNGATAEPGEVPLFRRELPFLGGDGGGGTALLDCRLLLHGMRSRLPCRPPEPYLPGSISFRVLHSRTPSFKRCIFRQS